ncbi:FHA domain-containing protein [Nonomuraea soli]|uniref:FHA domain-containing protein n=1 Tax=Nonomuraea soli TaxID=1032476 RepID=A0A7W0HMX2_9ACTN|nr:FHA domain-containing protein [Nonomuraea soli]MBA2889209.1 hypothetical protein [Nonomuraea soli]
MTAICPQGHTSGDDEYCDTCGDRIAGAAASSAPTSSSSSPAPTLCPVCQEVLADRYCEVCGHDSLAAVVPAAPAAGPVSWEAVVSADRAYFEKVIADGGPDAAAMLFPPYCPERSFPLSGQQVRIGRASRSRGTVPEIDLGAAPPDPGVSHLHAVLLGQDDGTWVLVDPGSANGTQLNGRPLHENVPEPVRDGDRIHVGAWTLITIRGSA